MNKALLLLSGGVDSVVLGRFSQLQEHDIHAVCVNYGQPAYLAEQIAARHYARRYGWSLEALRVELKGSKNMGASHGASVIPARNAVLLSMAANIAAVRGISSILIGATAEDYNDYLDCRRDWIESIGSPLLEASGAAVRAPFVTWSRADIVQWAHSNDMCLDMTWSCYAPVDKTGMRMPTYSPCGECASCLQEGSHAAAAVTRPYLKK